MASLLALSGAVLAGGHAYGQDDDRQAASREHGARRCQRRRHEGLSRKSW